MNKKPYKYILISTLCFLTVLSTGCTAPFSSDKGQETTDTISTAAEETVETAETTAEENVNDTTTSDSSTATSDICGKYAYTFTEEIGGQDVTAEYGYIFNEDNTGLAFAQDYVMFTWDDKQIHINGESKDYEIKDGVLTFTGADDKQEYTKKDETDPVLNGDFSEYAGFYKPTDTSNKEYGDGDKIVDLEIHEDGSITGCYPVSGNTLIKQVAPAFVMKESYGAYTCLFADKDSIEDFNQGKYLEYTIYPASSVPENLRKESGAADKVHISLRKIDGEVYTPNFFFEGKEVQ